MDYLAGTKSNSQESYSERLRPPFASYPMLDSPQFIQHRKIWLTLLDMDLALQSRFYRPVPVWLWPYVFVQLLALAAWCEHAEREEGILSICRQTGRVDLLFLSDDPRAPKLWRPADLAALLPGRRLAEAVDPAIANDPRRQSIFPHPNPPQNGEGTLRDAITPRGLTGSEPPSPFWGGSGWGLFTSTIGGQGPPSLLSSRKVPPL